MMQIFAKRIIKKKNKIKNEFYVVSCKGLSLLSTFLTLLYNTAQTHTHTRT